MSVLVHLSTDQIQHVLYSNHTHY